MCIEICCTVYIYIHIQMVQRQAFHKPSLSHRHSETAPTTPTDCRQGLLLRMALTSAFAFLLAKHSCVARVMRALYIYKSKLWRKSSGYPMVN